MPFVPVANTLMIESVYELDGQIVENTAYFLKPGGWDEASISAMLADVRDFIISDLLPLLSSIIQLVRVVGTLLDAADSIAVTLNVNPPSPGLDASGANPNNVTYTVTQFTSHRGRSNRGRNYVPGIPISAMDGPNVVTTDFRVALIEYYDGLFAVGTANGAIMGVVTRFSGVDSAGKAIPRTVGGISAITGFGTFDAILDSQRRRLPGRGA